MVAPRTAHSGLRSLSQFCALTFFFEFFEINSIIEQEKGFQQSIIQTDQAYKNEIANINDRGPGA